MAMDSVNMLTDQITKLRNELKNIRQEIKTLRHVHNKDVMHLKTLLDNHPPGSSKSDVHPTTKDEETVPNEGTSKRNECKTGIAWNPIGHVQSVFKYKNGTPRQANVCSNSKAILELRRDLFTNPEHALDGLEGYSHLWVIYIFHKNNNSYTKAKVKPPRLNGQKVGLFSTRCPYRPNPIGLSLVSLDRIEGSRLHLSGVDILDGTPILDVKPYIPEYDMPDMIASSEASSHTANVDGELPISKNREDHLAFPPESSLDYECSTNVERGVASLETLDSNKDRKGNFEDFSKSSSLKSDQKKEISSDNLVNDKLSPEAHQSTQSVSYASWIKRPPIQQLTVVFSNRADADLDSLGEAAHKVEQLKMTGRSQMKQAIQSILSADPRSTYRRQKCQDKLYYFSVGACHITCWFDDDDNVVEVLRVKPDHSER